jgi:hypothetical protein
MTVQINDKVLRVLQAEKISADELYHMLDEVAFTSLRGCNRRYFQWLFLVKDNVLQDMQRVELVEVGRGPHRMLEEHEPCNGAGCRACGWIGSVSRAIEDTTERAMHAAR